MAQKQLIGNGAAVVWIMDDHLHIESQYDGRIVVDVTTFFPGSHPIEDSEADHIVTLVKKGYRAVIPHEPGHSYAFEVTIATAIHEADLEDIAPDEDDNTSSNAGGIDSSADAEVTHRNGRGVMVWTESSPRLRRPADLD